ncbi:MAG: hypothetical protein H6662_14975 [Ardenticatenaceae bacterium]|nr:hypothetical protein [Anaerolineales bacterium]MCB8922889.1 hypothetical protein [Ardenticatenaceae bacterium]MCB8990374.1 hypothetical protein [Ardenticatenaceae bacterium]
MSYLKRIWEDIRRGENIDLFITVLIAIGLAILNIAGVAPATLIAPLTLAVLGLLAVATLGNRYKLEESLDTLNRTHTGLFQEKMPAEMDNDLRHARELWLVGITLNRTINTYYSALEQKLARGDTVRVLLVDPDGHGPEMLERREYKARYNVERIRYFIRDSLDDLCGLQQRFGGLEVRVIDYPLGYGGVLINPNGSNGRFYLEHYPFKTPGGSLPKFVLEAGDGRWYTFFKLEIETIWDNAAPWTCKS